MPSAQTRERRSAKQHTNSPSKNNNNNDGSQTNSNSHNKISNNTNANKTNSQKDKNLDLSSHPVRPVVKLTISQRNVTSEQKQLIDRFPGIDDRKDRIRSNKETFKTIQMWIIKLQPKL